MVEEMRGTIIKSIAEQTVNESIDDLNKFRDHRDFEQGLNKIFDEEAHDCQIKADNMGKGKKEGHSMLGYAKSNSIHAAAKKFGVTRSTIYDWKKQTNQLRDLNSKSSMAAEGTCWGQKLINQAPNGFDLNEMKRSG